jgi:hypothetical protein
LKCEALSLLRVDLNVCLISLKKARFLSLRLATPPESNLMTSQRKERHPPIITAIIAHQGPSKDRITIYTTPLKQQRQRQSSDTLADRKKIQS